MKGELWRDHKPVVAMIHLLSLPGSPGWGGSMDRVLERAVAEARILVEGGVDGLLVENFGDTPFFPSTVPPETLAAMAVAAKEVIRYVQVPVGINVLRNDAQGALAAAVAAGAAFVRVNVHVGCMFTDQGVLQGRAHDTLRLRRNLGAEVAILADVLVKHGTAPPGVSLAGAARDTLERGRADGIILTGAETGSSVRFEELDELRTLLPPEASLWVGSGSTPESAAALLRVADGIIVGSALQSEGRAGGGVEPGRVEAFMRSVRPRND